MVLERFFKNSPYTFCFYTPIIIIYENSSEKSKKNREQTAKNKESKEFSLLYARWA